MPQNQNPNGSTVISIYPTEGLTGTLRKGSREINGWGFEIVSGASAFKTRSALSLSMLGLDADDSGTNETNDKRWRGSEVFDGALMMGRFRGIRALWEKSSDYAGETPEPVVLRVFHEPHQVGAVMSPTPLGPGVIDVYDGQVDSVSAGPGVYTTLYDDTAEVALTHNAENMEWAEGVGNDMKNGPHRSIKRRLFFCSTVNNTTSGHSVLIEMQLPSGGVWFPFAELTETVVSTDVSGTWRTIRTPDGGLLVPAKIRIRYQNPSVSGVSPGTWMWMSGV